MFKLKDLKSEKLKRSTSRIILYAILDKASFEEKSSVKIGQTYLSENYCISTKTVGKELKYLKEQGYITYKRSLYNNLTTTEITLTDKSIAILNAEASKPQNKPHNKTINTEPRQPQAETEKTQGTAPKQADKVHESETEQTEEQAFQTEIEKMNAMYRSLNNIQKGCATALKRAKTDNPVYIREAQERGVPQVLIDFILKYNKMKREERNYENV